MLHFHRYFRCDAPPKGQRAAIDFDHHRPAKWGMTHHPGRIAGLQAKLSQLAVKRMTAPKSGDFDLLPETDID